MDEGWGNIIYLIAAVLFGIISMFKKKKQPNVLNPSDGDEQQVSEDSTSGLDSVLGTLLGVEISKPKVQLEEESEVVAQETMMEEYARKEKEKAATRKETQRTTFTDLDSIKLDGVEEIEMEEDEKEEIDWRQAIIYKEILDRKYN